MKVKNIFTKYKKTKEIFKDNRGIIADIFYKNSINHVAMIVSKPNVIRGNHYHKKTTQYILVTSGTLEYWYKKLNDKKKSRSIILTKGDLVSTPPKEIHALKIGKFGNEFVVFSKGLRGGIDYEKDTYRVPSIINSE